jgi:hypothetical protein
MCGVDHLGVCASSASGKRPEQVFPDAAPCPTHEAVIDRCRRTILGRAITPAAAAPQDLNDPADHTPLVHACLATNITRQMPGNPLPFTITQPIKVLAHLPSSESEIKEIRNRFNQQGIYWVLALITVLRRDFLAAPNYSGHIFCHCLFRHEFSPTPRN